MTIELDVGGRRQMVDVRREDDAWLVTLNGRRLSVSVAEAAGRWSLLVGSRSHEVFIEPRPGGEHVVHVDGRAIAVTIADAPRSSAPGPVRPKRDERGGGPAQIVAPMTGRIVKVLVRAGDVVEVRQGLVVVEAMKMENELRAPRPGTVTDVRVSEGMSVEANAVLVVIE